MFLVMLLPLLSNFLLNQFNRSFVICNPHTTAKSLKMTTRNSRIKWGLGAALLVGIIGSLIATHIDKIFV